jgi:hypothetical protein
MIAPGFWQRIAHRVRNRFGRRQWYVHATHGAGRILIPGYKSQSAAVRYVARNLRHLVIIHVDAEHAFIFCKVAN